MARGVLRIGLLCGFLVSAVALAAVTRPASPARTSPFAAPVGELRVVDGLSEGQRFINSLPAEVRQQLNTDRRVLLPEDQSKDGAMAGYIKAVALFSQPKDRVYTLITDPSTQVLFLPRLEQSTTVRRTAEGELTEFHLAVSLATVKFRTQHWWWPNHSRIEWALDPSWDNDIKVAGGFWQVFALDEKTSVGEYGTQVDTGLPVPEALATYLTRKDMPAALDAFQKYIDSNGAWRRVD